MCIKTIVCFANSRKKNGYCVAGKEQNGVWVRPISARSTHELSESEQRCSNGTMTQPLDIVEITCKEHDPSPHQKENYLNDDTVQWVKKGRLEWHDIEKYLDQPKKLWLLDDDSDSSSTGCCNNRITSAEPFQGVSLYLIAVKELTLIVGKKSTYSDARRSVVGHFIMNEHVYKLGVTDSFIEDKYLLGNDGIFQINNAILCISLAGLYSHNNDDPLKYHYKLIASVLYKDRFQ